MGLVLKNIKTQNMISKHFSIERVMVMMVSIMSFRVVSDLCVKGMYSIGFMAIGGMVGYLITMPDPVYPRRMLLNGLLLVLKHHLPRRHRPKVVDAITTIDLVDKLRIGEVSDAVENSAK
ncbi:MAG: hypothetical protein Q4P72_06130 [Eubacteriales bacterium]|nr:hypothetical protein [Eubacteriales bacterium]